MSENQPFVLKTFQKNSISRYLPISVILYNLQGWSVEETAGICDISVATAKMRIHRAQARLRKALGEKCVFYKSADGNITMPILPPKSAF